MPNRAQLRMFIRCSPHARKVDERHLNSLVGLGCTLSTQHLCRPKRGRQTKQPKQLGDHTYRHLAGTQTLHATSSDAEHSELAPAPVTLSIAEHRILVMLGTFFPMPPILTACTADRTGDTSSKARLSVHKHALLSLVVF
jgi:hypothetical protein